MRFRVCVCVCVCDDERKKTRQRNDPIFVCITRKHSKENRFRVCRFALRRSVR